MSEKWLQRRKMNDKKFKENHQQLLIVVLEISKNPHKNVSASETCGITKYRLYYAVSSS